MIGAAFVFGALFVAPRIGAAAFAAATIFGSAVAALAIDHGAALRAIGAAGWQPGWHLPVTRWSDAGHGKDVLGEIDADVDNGHGLPLPSELMRVRTSHGAMSCRTFGLAA